MANTGRGSMREIDASANRLRLIQLDLIEEAEEVRESYLAEEVKRQLGSVPPGQRAEYLEQLRQRFPAWDTQVDVSRPSEQGALRSAADEKDLNDWSFLVSRLSDLAATLSEEVRQVIRDRLAAAGLAYNRPDPGWQEAITKATRTEFQLDDQHQIDVSRALELLAVLAKCVKGMNKVVWTTWREIDHRSKIRGGGSEFEHRLTRFVAGAQDVDPTMVSRDLERLSQLVAALIGGIRGGAGTFARTHCDTFSIEAISRLVEVEGGGFLAGSKEAKRWRKFEELAGGALDPDSIEREILQAVGATATELLERNRPVT
ncbi:MAG: hypothetical protein V3T84_06435 [Phycisphaerales bacterium]